MSYLDVTPCAVALKLESAAGKQCEKAKPNPRMELAYYQAASAIRSENRDHIQHCPQCQGCWRAA